LSDDAAEYWDALAPMLARMNLLDRIDEKALARYCQTWSHWRKADAFIAKNGLHYVIKDNNGNAKYVAQFPEVAIAGKLSMQLLRFEQEFGLTPSARARVEASVGAAGAANISGAKREPPTPTDRPLLRIAE
jgi:P27 family predicted phage terminase small subunit